jgi:serine/threonine-protein kinase
MTQSASTHVGRTLGRYQLLVPIAMGATAEVWAARTTGAAPGRRSGGRKDDAAAPPVHDGGSAPPKPSPIVAIKLMLAELHADSDTESMFLDEARLVSRIRHPNVASVLDLGADGEAFYIVMEWVAGEPLQVVLREVARSDEGRLPLPMALRIVKLCASGLHAAHELLDDQGKPVELVHRDVSPSNILVGYDGAVKVIDFGVAKAAINLQRTVVGQIKGKVPYMAPEQAAGEKVDRRSDVFALGIVLYQLLTGKHPFRGENEFVTLGRIRDKNPADSARVHVPDLPAAVDAVVQKALAKAREDRYPTMLALGEALDEALSPPADIDRTLGRFMAKLLSQRVQKREQAIRDAVATADEQGSQRRDLPRVNDWTAGVPKAPGFFSRSTSDSAPTSESAPTSGAPPTSTPVPAPAKPAIADVRPGDLPQGMRARPQGRRGLVAAIVVILVVLAILALASGMSTPGDAPVKRAF